MSRTDTWMPLYIADYLADTRRLSTIEHGAYLLLIMEYWRLGPLPDDDRSLAAIALVDRRVWAREVGPAVRRFFTVGDDKLLHQKRIDAERARAADLSDKRRANALQRYSKKDAIAPALAPANRDANDMQKGVHARVAVQSQSQRKKDSEPEDGSAPKGARDLLWEQGPGIVTRLTGLPDNRARGLLGKLAKVAEDDCQRVLEALNEATRTRPVGEVTAWLLKRVMVRDDGPRDELTGRRVTPMSGGF